MLVYSQMMSGLLNANYASMCAAASAGKRSTWNEDRHTDGFLALYSTHNWCTLFV